MKCKFCNAELEEDALVCPVCGKAVTADENSEDPAILSITHEEAEEVAESENVSTETGKAVRAKPKVWMIVLASVCCVALLAVLAGFIWVSANGGFTPRPNDLKYKDSYTVSDKAAAKAADKVVAVLGDHELTNGQLQIYYWLQIYDYMYYMGNQASLYGLDYSKPLDEQTQLADPDTTWQQFFLDVALTAWQRDQVLTDVSEAAGHPMSGDYKTHYDNLLENMTKVAVDNGYASIDEMIAKDMGAGCSFADYQAYIRLYYTGCQYYDALYEELDPTYEQIDAYYEAHSGEFEENGIIKEMPPVVDVRHILIAPSEEQKDVYTDEEWEACLAEAQSILDQWLEEGGTEERFAELAKEYSVDGGSSSNGGLYEDVTKGRMVAPFDEWCFDETRSYGDYGLVKTQFGYHIMFFVDSRELWYLYARENLISELANEAVSAEIEKYPMEVNYKNIVLGHVDLGA